MNRAEVIVVGSGAAGVWAAFELLRQGRSVLMLDVGYTPAAAPPLEGSFPELRAKVSGQESWLIGDAFESLHNISHAYLSPKLKSPRFRYVTEATERLTPLRQEGFHAVQSLAAGGLANAWGAGAYRYNAADLAGFPLSPAELEPYYDELTRRIGIAGEADDLTPWFGSAEGLQPPHPLDRVSERLLRSYQRNPGRFRKRGIFLGRTRLAVLSRSLGDRPACTYDNMTFWDPSLDYVYTPRITLAELRANRRFLYRDSRLVSRFEETAEGVEVVASDVQSGSEEVFTARRLILAAGALNSARIVLRSFGDHESRLPLMDNQVSMIPLVYPPAIGSPVDYSSHGLGQLNLVYEEPGGTSYQATLYGFQSLLSSEVIMEFPFAMRGSAAACRYLLPSFLLTTLFYPDEPEAGNFASLDRDGRLRLAYARVAPAGAVERKLIRALLGAGFVSHPSLVKTHPPGNGIHYAGTLPMRSSGDRYTTEPRGRLRPTNRVYVADAAVFPRLPARNHTLTIMANAMRVARAAAADMDALT